MGDTHGDLEASQKVIKEFLKGGALPNLNNLKEVNKIKNGDKNWQEITWGDFQETEGSYLDINPFSGRPQFGKDWFETLIERFNKKILIRSHQPDAALWMFNKKCLTIFTSGAYQRERNMAIFENSKKDSNRYIEIKQF